MIRGEQNYSIFVAIVMAGWIPLVIAIFSALPPRRALLVSFLFAFLFMPHAVYNIQYLPPYTKMSATSIGALLGVLIFDPGSLVRFRPKWPDAVPTLLCFSPMISSLTNGLGANDAFSAFAEAVLNLGIPYLLGRLYITDLAGLRELAFAIFIGGLIYVPLCLYEIRMSPQLHYTVYGFHAHGFAQTQRWGGWRPTVFLRHGLLVGLWMTSASVIGVWLWLGASVRRFLTLPMPLFVVSLLVTTVLVKSTGALVLLAIGLALFAAIRLLRSELPLIALILAILVFLGGRATGVIQGNTLVDIASIVVGAERAQSLEYRFTNENRIAVKAWEKPAFGWGRWGRYRVADEYGRETVTDSHWIIALGSAGLFGLTLTTAFLLLPPVLLGRRIPSRYWNEPAVSPSVACAVILVLWMIDRLVNDFQSPVFFLIAGGLFGLEPARLQHRAAPRGSNIPNRPRAVYES